MSMKEVKLPLILSLVCWFSWVDLNHQPSDLGQVAGFEPTSALDETLTVTAFTSFKLYLHKSDALTC